MVPMYELSHDLIGALSPMIVVLAMMMMTGGAGGSSSYVFSGKTDDVGFLLLKARATARKLACAHRRTAERAIALNPLLLHAHHGQAPVARIHVHSHNRG